MTIIMQKEIIMPALQIRDVPESIYAQYKQRCAEEDRSMAQQTLRLIKMYLASTTSEVTAHTEAFPTATSTCMAQANMTAQSPWSESIYNPMADIIGREERIAKRKALFKRIDEQDFGSIEPPPGYSSFAEMIREDRENDLGRTWVKELLSGSNGLQCSL